MAVLRINAARDGQLGLSGSDAAWTGALDAALARIPRHAPVCILVHGYRYTFRPRTRDGAPVDCPQDKLYRVGDVEPTRLRRPPQANWPEQLGFTGTGARDGLCIAFGWDGRRHALGTLAGLGRNDFSLVYEAAETAGTALARILGHVAGRRPGLAIDFLTHSLGARVALAAMRRRPDLKLGRAILLGAAEFASVAAETLARQATAGGSVEVYHAMSRANDLYDVLFGLLAPRSASAGQTSLGRRGLGGSDVAAGWIDIQLDHPATLAWLAGRGIALERAAERVSHWHFYADPGAMTLWRTILRERPAWSIAALRAERADRIDPRRWSRLVPEFTRFRFPERAAEPSATAALGEA